MVRGSDACWRCAVAQGPTPTQPGCMKRRAVTLAAGALLVLAGCSDESSTSPVPFGTQHVDKSLGMPTAEVRGTLVLADSCLMVQFEGQRYPLVLPDVATWDEHTEEVTIEGRTYAMGDEVSWVGGYGPGPEVANSCPAGVEAARVFETS